MPRKSPCDVTPSTEPTQPVSPQAVAEGETATSAWPMFSASSTPRLSDCSPCETEKLQIIGDRFRVEETLGVGAFGAVYRCFDERLHHRVAVKLAHDRCVDDSQQFDELLHEARAAAQVKHPHIVGVRDVGKTADRRPYVVYDLFCGQSLQHVIKTGQYTLAEAIAWIADLADALHVAHKSRLVHRDVKPANILIDDQHTPLLTDFGLARIDDRFFVPDRGYVGTAAYMSPEQAAGLSHLATPQSDLYSLGVVLYELICGKRPFESENWNDLCEQILHKAVVPPRTLRDDVPAELERISLRTLAKKSDERYTCGKDLAAALRAALPRANRLRFAGLIVTLAGLAMLAAGGLWLVAASPFHPAEARSLEELIPALTLDVSSDAGIGIKKRALSAGDDPWGTGEKVTIEARLRQPAHLYLYWYEETTAGWRLVSRLLPDSLERQRPALPVFNLTAVGQTSSAPTAKLPSLDVIQSEYAAGHLQSALRLAKAIDAGRLEPALARQYRRLQFDLNFESGRYQEALAAGAFCRQQLESDTSVDVAEMASFVIRLARVYRRLEQPDQAARLLKWTLTRLPPLVDANVAAKHPAHDTQAHAGLARIEVMAELAREQEHSVTPVRPPKSRRVTAPDSTWTQVVASAQRWLSGTWPATISVEARCRAVEVLTVGLLQTGRRRELADSLRKLADEPLPDDDPRMKARWLGHLARQYERLGDDRAAAELFERALALAQSVAPTDPTLVDQSQRELADLAFGAARANVRLKQTDRAGEFVKSATEKYRALETTAAGVRERLHAVARLEELAELLGDLPEAIRTGCHLIKLQEAELDQFDPRPSCARTSIASLCMASGDVREAFELAQRGWAFFENRQRDDAQAWGAALFVLSQAEQALGQFEASLARLKKNRASWNHPSIVRRRLAADQTRGAIRRPFGCTGTFSRSAADFGATDRAAAGSRRSGRARSG